MSELEEIRDKLHRIEEELYNHVNDGKQVNVVFSNFMAKATSEMKAMELQIQRLKRAAAELGWTPGAND